MIAFELDAVCNNFLVKNTLAIRFNVDLILFIITSILP